MLDHRITSRPALAGKQPISSDVIGLRPLPEGHVVHVLAKTGGQDLATFLAGVTNNVSHVVRTGAPGQWFLVGDTVMSQSDMNALFEKLLPHASGVDQSHGRVRIRAQGATVERMLAKGTAVDLALSSFPVGHATTTVIGHISAHITRVGENMFDIMTLRGFAESLWDDLLHMSAEFA